MKGLDFTRDSCLREVQKFSEGIREVVTFAQLVAVLGLALFNGCPRLRTIAVENGSAVREMDRLRKCNQTC